jgi:hypothetical protein
VPPSLTLPVRINPNDLNHPLALHFCGIKLDLGSADGIPKLVQRARLLSANPVASADFFETMIQAVIRGLLQYEKHETQYVSKHIGLFGRVKNYYGMVLSPPSLNLWIASMVGLIVSEHCLFC